MNLLTLRDVAKAVQKTERGLRKDVDAGRFGPDVIRLGRSVRVRTDEFTEWIRAGCPDRQRWLLVRDRVV